MYKDPIEINSLQEFIVHTQDFAQQCKVAKHAKENDFRKIQSLVIDRIIGEIKRKGNSLITSVDSISSEKMIDSLEKRKKALPINGYYEASICRPFYRGQSDITYPLLPSIMRCNSANVNEMRWEDYYYRQINILCPADFIGRSHIDYLALMQHYGCHTRLLDVSGNPLVALYFACGNPHKDGMVYAFAPREADILSYDSDRALVLSSLAKLSDVEKNRLYETTCKKLCEGKKFDDSHGTNEIERLYHEVRVEKPSFEKKIDPLDLLSFYFIQPLKDNARIIKQDGAFIICGLSRSTSVAAEILRDYVAKMFLIRSKEKILNELDLIGINQATLFPEVYMVADYLNKRCKMFTLSGERVD